MIRSVVFFLFSLLSFNISILAQNTYIQIVAEPDISIFLDGQFKGITNTDLGGLIVELETGGNHSIKIVKEGYVPQEENISVKRGEVVMYTVKALTPKIKIRQEGNDVLQTIASKTGDLRIQSLPVGISIKIEQLGVDAKKTEDKWYADNIPEGNYIAKFSWNDKVINESIQIKAGLTTVLFVNMLNKKIDITTDSIISKDPIELEIQYQMEAERNRYSSERTSTIQYSENNRPSNIVTNNNSGITYGLGARALIGYAPYPNVYSCQITSRIEIKVEIQVDQKGNVISASILSATFADNCLWNSVVEAAKKTKFTSDPGASYRQTGWIKYIIEP